MKLIKAKDLEGNLIIVNLEELKQYERLKDANVFKLLFGINEDSQFGDFKLEETDGYINLFKDFGITRTEWNLFLNFLKYGYTPYYNEKIDGISTERAKSNVESLNNLCHIFGGLNSFDEFYKKFYKENNTEVNYNPQCPKEDIKNLYNWTIIDDGHVYNLRDFACTHREEDGWSAQKYILKDTRSFVWYRKLKDS